MSSGKWRPFRPQCVIAPGRLGSNFRNVISKQKLWIKFVSMFCEIALRWIPQNDGILPKGSYLVGPFWQDTIENTFDDKSTLS